METIKSEPMYNFSKAHRKK
jgi:hypothetical protein